MILDLWRPGRGRAAMRLPLLAPAAVFRVTARARRAWHASQRPSTPLPRPGVIVGNLTVGGTGKTPIAAWCARWLADRGVRPGIVVHAVARDEGLLHEAWVPEAIVMSDTRRRHAAQRAIAAGAEALVFDDGLQHPGLSGVRRIALVAVEQMGWSRWPLPAGPWREGLNALATADVVVVTRKTASADEAAGLADRLARFGRPVARAWLAPGPLRRLHGGAAVSPSALAGRAVLAVAGIADPEPFRAHLEALGARVRLRTYPDHHDWREDDVTDLLEQSCHSDYVVVTSKDAAKLRFRWPAVPDPLVAGLVVHWDGQRAAVEAVLDQLRNPRR